MLLLDFIRHGFCNAADSSSCGVTRTCLIHVSLFMSFGHSVEENFLSKILAVFNESLGQEIVY